MQSYYQDNVDIPVEDSEDTPIDDPEETISICDICNTIIGESMFVIEPEGTVNYYQEDYRTTMTNFSYVNLHLMKWGSK